MGRATSHPQGENWPLDTYWTIFDFMEKQEPVQGSLAGDISEIYFDLKQSLHLDEISVTKSDVLFDWRLLTFGLTGADTYSAL